LTVPNNVGSRQGELHGMERVGYEPQKLDMK
jgi:hypothetical protein